MPAIRRLHLSGSHYEMGRQHGEAFADEIRQFTKGRTELSMDPIWAGKALPHEQVIAIADAMLAVHREYAPELVEEMQGIADATGLSLADLVVVGGFTDFVDVLANVDNLALLRPVDGKMDECTAFIVPDSRAIDGKGFIGQTWDMHKDATPHVILLDGHPQDEPSFMVFTSVGCVGMIGMNSEGIAIGINNLRGADGQIGVTWPFVVRKALMQRDIEAAVRCITEAPLAGAHNYVVRDANGKGYNIEALPTSHTITPLSDESIVHTNHCLAPQHQELERPSTEERIRHSEGRLKRAQRLLQKPALGVEDLMVLTRDRAGNGDNICVYPVAPSYVETSGAVIMRPATREFWAVWGHPDSNEYERFIVN